MKHSIKITCATIVLLVLGGCATVGNEQMRNQSQESIAISVQKGKTTQNEIVNIYGNPNKTTLTDGGNEVWTYEYERAVPQPQNFIPFIRFISSAYNSTKMTLVIMFDKSGVVSNYTARESLTVLKTGLAH